MLSLSGPSGTKVVFFVERPSEHDLSSLFRQLRLQSKISDHTILRWLLVESTTVLREEIRRLPSELKGSLPPFQTVPDLCESYAWQASPLAGPLSNVFSCLVSLCLFVG